MVKEAGLMEDEEWGSGRRVWKYLKNIIMFIAPMGMLVWITCHGYRLTVMTRYTAMKSSQGNYIAILFGVVTVVFGLIYFVVGLTIIAERTLDFFARLQKGDSGNKEKERSTNCQVFVHSFAITVSMLMLTWTIYYGYKLAAEAQEVVIYNRLAFFIGVISMAFGFVYFIIGLGIVAESTLHLSGRLHQVADENDALLDSTEMNLEV
ncbi:hypothetical protein KSS87_016283 [Heliosperma pusillum]|nr:hypothetical protein KSS87_016283 [Heliosperma pusillum]